MQLWSCADIYCQGLESEFRRSARSLSQSVITETHLTDGVDLSLARAKSVLGQVTRNCTSPRVMVVIVQREQARFLFQACFLDEAVQQSLIWIGPSSVTGLDVELPKGYLGPSSAGLTNSGPEFVSLETRWNSFIASNHPWIRVLSADQVRLKTWPYVGFAYDAVLAFAHAIHATVEGGGDIYNSTALKEPWRQKSISMVLAQQSI